MNISIFGLGYVGCVGVGCLSKQGHTIVGVDVSDVKVDLINNGKATIVEKDIDALAASAIADVCTPGNPRDIDEATIKELYKKIL